MLAAAGISLGRELRKKFISSGILHSGNNLIRRNSSGDWAKETEMGMSIVADHVSELGDQTWLLEMPPHQVRMFGETRSTEGARSIILLKKALHDPIKGVLQFDADDAIALNVGTSQYAVAVGGGWSPAQLNDSVKLPKQSYGPGDQEFLRVAGELPKDMQAVAVKLLEGVRGKSPGDLKRGKQRNFSNTPDNFWYVIVQPRIAGLSITVRGAPSRFPNASRLELKDDRPGYTRFKIVSMLDVPEALELIFASKKKR